MVDLISQNQPSSLDAFIINFQTWVQFIVRTLPLRMMNKGEFTLFLILNSLLERGYPLDHVEFKLSMNFRFPQLLIASWYMSRYLTCCTVINLIPVQ